MSPLRAVILAIVSSGVQSADDKASIPYQLSEGHALAERIGGKVIAELVVPGFSRDYNNFDECEREMSASGIDAFARLRHMWEHKVFDVLICREGSRLGREQSILAEVIQRTIQANAEIYLTSGGKIDRSNYRFMSAMLGLTSAKENDERVERKRMGVAKAAQRGLPVTHIPLLSHVVIRDGFGRRLYVERNEWFVPILRDAVQLVLEGVGWDHIEDVLFERFGHTDQRGIPFKYRTFWRVLLHPFFWGHNALGFKRNHAGVWVFDDSFAPPAGLTVYRNTHKPFWRTPADLEATLRDQPDNLLLAAEIRSEIDLADRVKAECLRRSRIIIGRARPGTTKAFSGMLICEQCHSFLHAATKTYESGATNVYYRCQGRYYRYRRECTQTMGLRPDAVQKYFHSWLSQILNDDDLTALLDNEQDRLSSENLLVSLEKEMAQLQANLDQLITDKLAATSIAVQKSYNLRIEALGLRLDAATAQAEQVRRSLTNEEVQSRQRALQEIKRVGLNQLWELPSREINQILHQFLGNWRLRVADGEIIGRLRYHGKRQYRRKVV